ncbi:MAG: RecQ family ATP-dependent DNA helicase [Treponema sp.]|nr:RecQ family ATP-dependent DNA helicase [Treponema sp.]
MGEDTHCLQTDVLVGEDDTSLQTDDSFENDNTPLQNTPLLQTESPVEKDNTSLQTDVTENDNAPLQTTPCLLTEAPVEKNNISLQNTPLLLTEAPVEKDNTSLQTNATEDATALQTANATEEEECFFYRGRQIVLLPTGAGKSLCFLTPALLLKGPTLVIYPLLALMADQKRRMDSGGIESVIFRGGQSPQEREENFAKIKKGAKIIIANPEVLQNKSIVKELAVCKIQHIAIDEAHCVSEWGDSFRPAYLTLGKIIEELGCKTVTAFTATASPQVLDRVSQVLFGGQSHIVRSDADRSNIRYNVIYAAAKKREAFRLALTEQKPLLIFCGTRAKSEDMARELALYMGQDKVKFYHAGLEKAEKTATEEWFFGKTNAVLCCTCAYGMGVDKKDIKTVIHLESPPTAESYLQESGRIARDGSIGKAILLWNYADHKKFSTYPKNSREYKMLLFAESSTCRRQVLLDALGAEEAVCSGCDVCERGGKAPFAYDLDLALKFFASNRKMYTYKQASALLESQFNSRDLNSFGLRIWEQEDTRTILCELEERKFIRKCLWPWKDRITCGKDMYGGIEGIYRSKKWQLIKKKERSLTEAHLKIRRSFMSNRRKLVNKIIGKIRA